MIPKRIYAAWCGGKPLPEHDNYIDSWREKLPDYEIHLLGDDDIPSSRCTRAMRERGKIVSAAQYACWSRLYETGGIYLDLDVDVVRSFDDLLTHDAFLGIEYDGPNQVWAACGVLGAVAHHPFIRECLDYMDTFNHTHPEAENELGPRMFTTLLQRHGWKRTNADTTVSGVRLLNSTRFYPYSWKDTLTPECITDETYAVHMWAHTWNPVLDEPVSVIIPCYNQAQYLPDAIESALGQTAPPHEIIVVDDGSTVGDVAAVVKLYPSVRLITQKNGGVSAARNAGIEAATGTWICCLDADDRLHPRFIARLIGRGDIVSPKLETFGTSHTQTWPAGKTSCPKEADFVQGNQIICGSLFRRVWWEKVGGYDEKMRDGYEDWDFWTRIVHAGAWVTFLGDILFYYRMYTEDRSDVRGSIACAKKNDAAVQAYMRSKWASLGVKMHSGYRGLIYPIKLGVTVQHKGVTYHHGDSIDHPTALMLKKAGLLRDERIV